MKLIAGVDEVGRGPLAGPVIASAVIISPRKRIADLTDSKLLTPEERERVYEEIRKKATAIGIGRAEVSEIDTLNIFHASMLAMVRAIQNLPKHPELVLVDGNHAPKILIPCKTIIGGDLLEPCISAASIIAKVTRDREMAELDLLYPQYQFCKHKGYSTPDHLEALRQFGPSPIHRTSFAPVRDALLKENQGELMV